MAVNTTVAPVQIIPSLFARPEVSAMERFPVGKAFKCIVIGPKVVIQPLLLVTSTVTKLPSAKEVEVNVLPEPFCAEVPPILKL